MTSRRALDAHLKDLREGLRQTEVWLKNARYQRDRAARLAEARESALARVAKHFGFYDNYVVDERMEYRGKPDEWKSRRKFSADALTADLDAIDQAVSATEARKRLGIVEEDA